MVFDRDLMAELKLWAEDLNRMPLVLDGARQVGKTVLLKRFGAENFSVCHHFNFERDPELQKIFVGSLKPLRIIEELEVKIKEKIDPRRTLLFFDEIQLCEPALTAQKYFAEDLPGSFVVCAGSLLGLTLGSGSYPVGKVHHLTLHPLSFREFVQTHGQEPLVQALDNLAGGVPTTPFMVAQLSELLLNYFVCGGLPAAVKAWHGGRSKLEKIEGVKSIQGSIYKDYLADIAKHSGSENAMHIETVLNNIPSQLAREIDGSASKYQFKNVIKGKKSFQELRGAIEWLRRAGLVHQVFIVDKANTPLSAYCADNRFKLYLFDVGILRHLSGFQPEELLAWGDNRYKGFYAENFVLTELVAKRGLVPKCWREGESEVEFVLETSQGVIPVEVKSGTRLKSRSLKVFVEKYAPRRAYVLGGDRVHSTKDSPRVAQPLFAVPREL